MSDDPIDQISDEGIERYARQLVLPDIGVAGQTALGQAHMAIIGCGGLGANAALTLAQAGVGNLYLYDPDTVDVSNLHRQPFTTDQIGQPKALALAALCQARNPTVMVHGIPEKFTDSPASIWLDCTDTDASRRAVDGSRNPATRLVFGSVLGMDAQISVFDAGQPGFATLFPDAPPPDMRQTCAEQGVLGPLAIMTAQIMAAEAMKLAQGQPSTLHHSMLMIDARDWRFLTLSKPIPSD